MSSIIFHIENGVAHITLNRPDKLNAFNREMAILLQARLDQCASLHEVRAVRITGMGKAFSAGQDLSEITAPGGPTMSQILSEHYNPIVKKIRAMAIDMETATIFSVGFYNKIPTGALLLVSDQPMVAGGVKTEKSDSAVTTNFVDSHIQIGIDSLNELINNGNTVKHLRFD